MMSITDWSLPSGNPDRFYNRLLTIACGGYLVFQSLCFLSGNLFLVLGLWAVIALFSVVLIQRQHIVVLAAFLINSTSIYSMKGLYITAALLPLTAVLATAMFFMKKPVVFKFATCYLLMLISFAVSSVYAMMILGFGLSSAKLSVIFLLYFMAFYATYFILSESNYFKYLHFYIASGVCYVLGVYVMTQTHPYWVPNRLSVSQLIHPNQMCMYLELFFPIVFFCFVESARLRDRVIWGSLAVFFLVNMFLTYSKAGLIAVMVCFAYYFMRRISLKKIAAGCLLVGIFYLMFFGGFSKRLNTKNVDTYLSAYGRVQLYKTAVKVIKENHVIFGLGLNEFTKVKFHYGFKKYLDAERILSSHNMYLDFWMGLGLLALLAFLYILWKILSGLYRLPLVRLNGHRTGLIFSILSFLIHGMFDNNLPEGYLMIGFFILLGFSQFLNDHYKELELRAGSPDRFLKKQTAGLV